MAKICTNCKKEKSFDEFYNRTASKDGKTSQCKDCMARCGTSYKELHDKAEMLMAFRTLKRDIKKAAKN